MGLGVSVIPLNTKEGQRIRGSNVIKALSGDRSRSFDARRDSRASDNNKVVAIVSGNTVADHGRRTIEKLIDHAVSRNKLDS